jgi:hypothetical protein
MESGRDINDPIRKASPRAVRLESTRKRRNVPPRKKVCSVITVAIIRKRMSALLAAAMI